MIKNKTINFPEILTLFAFMLYLLGSSITLIQHGIELSLWLMTIAVLINILTTILPWLGFNWLALERKGSRIGYWLSVLVNFASWASFGYAMYLRLWRLLPQFYTMITVTTLLWAAGLIIFIYSRHACKGRLTGDKLEETQTNLVSNNSKGGQ
jgi:Na+/proline symporter